MKESTTKEGGADLFLIYLHLIRFTARGFAKLMMGVTVRVIVWAITNQFGCFLFKSNFLLSCSRASLRIFCSSSRSFNDHLLQFRDLLCLNLITDLQLLYTRLKLEDSIVLRRSCGWPAAADWSAISRSLEMQALEHRDRTGPGAEACSCVRIEYEGDSHLDCAAFCAMKKGKVRTNQAKEENRLQTLGNFFVSIFSKIRSPPSITHPLSGH